MAKGRVVVAMSGGVDSSVAAALLVAEGYEVIGVTMEIWPEMERGDVAHKGGCCSLAAVDDARRVAETLGIRYYVMNLRERFQHSVIDYFKAEYLSGRTPNPCIACNRSVKFDTLLEKARELGADKLATGHYARVGFEDGRYTLMRAVDPRKDQSYVLYNLGQDQLKDVLFPVGAFSKPEIRARAAALGLDVAHKPDSQEICFVDDDYRTLLQAEAEAMGEGVFKSTSGEVLGPAPGVAFFTIGQRKGIHIPHQEPLYVVDLIPEENAVVVGTRDELFSSTFTLEGVHYTGSAPPEGPFETEIKVRSMAPMLPGRVLPLDDQTAEVELHVPQRAVTPGQAAVFYDQDVCLGGGIICRQAS